LVSQGRVRHDGVRHLGESPALLAGHSSGAATNDAACQSMQRSRVSKSRTVDKRHAGSFR
jgi:hypothetical protein